MPDLSDISKGNVRKAKMGGSASKNIENHFENRGSHENEKRFAAEERHSLNSERPSRPTPPNRPLPVITVSVPQIQIIILFLACHILCLDL